MSEIREIVELNDIIFEELMKDESFTISYKNSEIRMTVTDNNIYKVKVNSKMKNGKIAEYENFSSYKEKVLKSAFDYAKKHEISNKKNLISYIRNQFETLFADIAKHLKATIIVCVTILVIISGFFVLNMDLKYNQVYTYTEKRDNYTYVHEVKFGRNNVYHSTTKEILPNGIESDNVRHNVSFYYIDEDLVVTNIQYKLGFERKNPWVITSYADYEKKISEDYICVSGIIVDVVCAITLGLDIFVLAYAIKKNKKVI